MFRFPRFVWLVLALVGAVVSVWGAEPARRNFNLPAGLAETTLRLFAEQAGGQFVFSAEKVAGVRTRSVKGLYTKQEALDRMLEGTGLRAVQDAETGALTVDRAGGAGQEIPEARKPEGRSAAAKDFSDWRNGNVSNPGLAPRAR
ncbi:MAG: STN domain-containing protein [Verrucomicrobiota bacterium]